MLRYWLAITLLGVLLCPGESSATEPPKPGATLSVVPSSTTLLEGDPLLLKGVLRNTGKDSVMLLRSFQSFTSGVRIEVCPPESKDFGRVHALSEGLFCGLHRPWSLESGKTSVCYSQLYEAPIQGAKLGAFATPGKWRVRMVTIVDGEDLASEPVTISVASRPKRGQDALREANVAIHQCLRSGGNLDSEELENALKARDLLAFSEAGRAITEAQILRGLQNAGSARVRDLAMKELNQYRDGLGDMAREHFDLMTVRVLLNRKEYADARKLLDPIKEENSLRNLLLIRLLTESEK